MQRTITGEGKQPQDNVFSKTIDDDGKKIVFPPFPFPVRMKSECIIQFLLQYFIHSSTPFDLSNGSWLQILSHRVPGGFQGLGGFAQIIVVFLENSLHMQSDRRIQFVRDFDCRCGSETGRHLFVFGK